MKHLFLSQRFHDFNPSTLGDNAHVATTEEVDSCSERSYLSVIGVPRLGCKKCSAYSRGEGIPPCDHLPLHPYAQIPQCAR
ncbi:Diguanylate cyclase (GGDEF) domain-containing protein [Operophtera brumata]|uniref:Diguanylate cyclase (GGDEF) domain-containing protein n=1 Tax=Operophtera brumata TaxID=104452 RepID=A0A0L7LF22_OPEBR|nr:Diguanylate cyclase (GGDEF) domain-containing protein [Operophtera brumata]